MTSHRLHWLSRIPHRTALGVALVTLALTWLSACVVTQSPEPSEPAPGYSPGPEAPPPEPAPYPDAPYRNPGPDARRPLPRQPQPSQPHQRPAPAADCSQQRPSFACCKALTPECNSCQDNARAAQEQWDRECVSAGPVEPAPSQPAFDCNEAPGGMCCEANTAACNSCRRQAASERAAWARECQGKAPSQPPSQPVVNCSEPPGRMCCQAETAACHSCKREAASERAAWERQCQ